MQKNLQKLAKIFQKIAKIIVIRLPKNCNRLEIKMQKTHANVL